jgi:hypothetical protein
MVVVWVRSETLEASGGHEQRRNAEARRSSDFERQGGFARRAGATKVRHS